jgi:hypothetical protein
MATEEIRASFGEMASRTLQGLRSFVFEIQFTAMKILFEPHEWLQHSGANRLGERA